MMNRLIVLFSLVLFGVACENNEVQMYSGVNAIQLNAAGDTLKRYSFYFKDPKIVEDTICLRFRTTGYMSAVDREFILKQVEIDSVVNAIAGTHYKILDNNILRIPANEVFVDIPITLLRSNLKPRTSYFIHFTLEENNNFKLGEIDKLRCIVEFSADLMQPAFWDDYYSRFYLGAWNYNKHLWMIEQTGHNWDDKFFENWKTEPGLSYFWRDKLNELLSIYNTTHGSLLDDDGNEIMGFPN